MKMFVELNTHKQRNFLQFFFEIHINLVACFLELSKEYLI